MLLSRLVPSVSVWSVWDLPLWAWRQYAEFVDEYVEQVQQQNAEIERMRG